jgi:broad specificity phosphatase PhoE
VRLFVLVRHAESTLNLERRVNGDPTLEVPLTEQGEAEARRLSAQLAHLPLDACLHTRFGRTRLTAKAALAGRDDEVPLEVEPLLDDVDVGELEGWTIARYREWKHAHARSDRFPGGESLDEAALRYATAFRKLGAGPASCVLVVTHEIPVRYALNAAAGSDELDGPAHDIPNTTPFLFDEDALERAASRIEELTASSRVRA